jgi:murein DD-endopeptidase MepM/ murein hydrolase activator NlpD
LPYAKQGERIASSAALGYTFTVPVGRRVAVTVASDATDELFGDLFRVAPLRHERLTGALPGNRSEPFVVDVVESGDYVLRIQPPVGTTASCDVDIKTSALLAFPVEGVGRSAIWSAFGVERDGGRRAHRGVDIFAARGTPVLAAIDGWVTRVETTRVGGNVVWMQPLFGNQGQDCAVPGTSGSAGVLTDRVGHHSGRSGYLLLVIQRAKPVIWLRLSHIKR